MTDLLWRTHQQDPQIIVWIIRIGKNELNMETPVLDEALYLDIFGYLRLVTTISTRVAPQSIQKVQP